MNQWVSLIGIGFLFLSLGCVVAPVTPVAEPFPVILGSYLLADNTHIQVYKLVNPNNSFAWCVQRFNDVNQTLSIQCWT